MHINILIYMLYMLRPRICTYLRKDNHTRTNSYVSARILETLTLSYYH